MRIFDSTDPIARLAVCGVVALFSLNNEGCPPNECEVTPSAVASAKSGFGSGELSLSEALAQPNLTVLFDQYDAALDIGRGTLVLSDAVLTVEIGPESEAERVAMESGALEKTIAIGTAIAAVSRNVEGELVASTPDLLAGTLQASINTVCETRQAVLHLPSPSSASNSGVAGATMAMGLSLIPSVPTPGAGTCGLMGPSTLVCPSVPCSWGVVYSVCPPDIDYRFGSCSSSPITGPFGIPLNSCACS